METQNGLEEFAELVYEEERGGSNLKFKAPCLAQPPARDARHWQCHLSLNLLSATICLDLLYLGHSQS